MPNAEKVPLAYLEGREKAERGQAVVVHISAQTEVVRNSLEAKEKKGTQCQACKMLVNFFLRNGKSTQYFSDLPKIPNFVRWGLKFTQSAPVLNIGMFVLVGK